MWLTILLGCILAILILILIGICCDSDILENIYDWIVYDLYDNYIKKSIKTIINLFKFNLKNFWK